MSQTQDTEIWADSHGCCQYVAEALDYDEVLFEDGSPKEIWRKAAELAAEANGEYTETLHWGISSRTVGEVLLSCGFRLVGRSAVEYAEENNLKVTAYSHEEGDHAGGGFVPYEYALDLCNEDPTLVYVKS